MHKEIFACLCKFCTLLCSWVQLSDTNQFGHGKKQWIPVSDETTHRCGTLNLRQWGFQSINPFITILPAMRQPLSHLQSSLSCKENQHKPWNHFSETSSSKWENTNQLRDKPYFTGKLIQACAGHCNVYTEKVPVFLEDYNITKDEISNVIMESTTE